MEGKVFREFVGGLVTEGEGDDAVETVGNMDNFTLVANNLCVLARSSPMINILWQLALNNSAMSLL